MKTKSQKSIVLFELLISIVIISIISLITLKFSFNLYEKNNKNLNLNIAKMDLESTKIFLQKNDFNKVLYTNQNLIYNNRLLLDKVTKFEYTQKNNLIFIDICIKRKYEICKNWVFN